MSKILTLTATGLAGLVLGAGIGVAAAGSDADRPVERPAAVTVGSMMDMGAIDMESMDEMHAQMSDAMPTELAEQCDEMHAGMAQHMGSGQHSPMMGGAQAGSHAEHHPDREG